VIAAPLAAPPEKKLLLKNYSNDIRTVGLIQKAEPRPFFTRSISGVRLVHFSYRNASLAIIIRDSKKARLIWRGRWLVWLADRVLGFWKILGCGEIHYSLLSQAAPSPGCEWMGGGEIVLAEVLRTLNPTLWDEIIWIVEILGATVYDPLVRCYLSLNSMAKN
jgi:hypothetical protein